MAKPKYDGVVECVRYKPNGEILWVRAYERRGATFSDHIIIGREELIQKLKAGKKFVTGKRREFLAGTFDVFSPLRLIQIDGREVVVSGDLNANQDHLENVPII